MQQNRALLERTGRRHHVLTYAASVYDRTSNFNDDPELMEHCETAALVHRIGPPERNAKVVDGALLHALCGKAITLIERDGIEHALPISFDDDVRQSNACLRDGCSAS